MSSLFEVWSSDPATEEADEKFSINWIKPDDAD